MKSFDSRQELMDYFHQMLSDIALNTNTPVELIRQYEAELKFYEKLSDQELAERMKPNFEIRNIRA